MPKLWKEGPKGSWLLGKNEKKEDDVENLFVGAILFEEVSKSMNNEELEEWLGGRSVPLHITYTKKNLTNNEEYKIYDTVRNG